MVAVDLFCNIGRMIEMYVLNRVISPKQTNMIDAMRACGPRYFVFEEVMLVQADDVHTLSSSDGPNMKLSIFVVKMEKVTCQYMFPKT